MGTGSYNVGAMHGQVYFGDPYQYQRYMEMRHAVNPFPSMNIHQQNAGRNRPINMEILVPDWLITSHVT